MRVDQARRDQPAVEVLHVIDVDDVVHDPGQALGQLSRGPYPRDPVVLGQDGGVVPHLGPRPQAPDVRQQADSHR
jgi:hypothetical protein